MEGRTEEGGKEAMKVAWRYHLCESDLSQVLFQNTHSSLVDVLLPSSLNMVDLSSKQGDFCCSIWWLTLRSAGGTDILSWPVHG